MLEAMGERPVGLRNKVLTALMWRSGLRLAEALALVPDNIDRDSLTIRILHGKGDKARTVAMDRQTLLLIDDWMEVRPAGPEQPLICTMKGEDVEQAYVRLMYPRIAKKAGVTKRVHAHGFRHTFAVELARANVPMAHIQRLLGHSSLATTAIYLASLSPEEALDSVRSRTW